MIITVLGFSCKKGAHAILVFRIFGLHHGKCINQRQTIATTFVCTGHMR
jgi:hypothetical protein